MLYYKSVLEGKNKQFQNIVKSIDTEKNVELNDFVKNMADLNDRFERVSREADEMHVVSLLGCILVVPEWFSDESKKSDAIQFCRNWKKRFVAGKIFEKSNMSSQNGCKVLKNYSQKSARIRTNMSKEKRLEMSVSFSFRDIK